MNRDLARSQIRRGDDRDEKDLCPHREPKPDRQAPCSHFPQ
jgi:hypothetical protein